MNYYEANRILDRVRDGAQFSEDVILQALYLTGDHEPVEIKAADEKFFVNYPHLAS